MFHAVLKPNLGIFQGRLEGVLLLGQSTPEWGLETLEEVDMKEQEERSWSTAWV